MGSCLLNIAAYLAGSKLLESDTNSSATGFTCRFSYELIATKTSADDEDNYRTE